MWGAYNVTQGFKYAVFFKDSSEELINILSTNCEDSTAAHYGTN